MSTESGISIEEQQGEGIENRNRSFDREPNVNDRNELHLAKQNVPMISTESGIQIDCSEVAMNARSSIIVSSATDSNITASTDPQPAKQPLPRRVTVDGIDIDFSDEHRKKCGARLEKGWIPIQMLDPQVERNRKLRIRREFALMTESISISMMNSAQKQISQFEKVSTQIRMSRSQVESRRRNRIRREFQPKME
jgi:hypothetical protein